MYLSSVWGFRKLPCEVLMQPPEFSLRDNAARTLPKGRAFGPKHGHEGKAVITIHPNNLLLSAGQHRIPPHHP